MSSLFVLTLEVIIANSRPYAVPVLPKFPIDYLLEL